MRISSTHLEGTPCVATEHDTALNKRTSSSFENPLMTATTLTRHTCSWQPMAPLIFWLGFSSVTHLEGIWWSSLRNSVLSKSDFVPQRRRYWQIFRPLWAEKFGMSGHIAELSSEMGYKIAFNRILNFLKFCIFFLHVIRLLVRHSCYICTLSCLGPRL